MSTFSVICVFLLIGLAFVPTRGVTDLEAEVAKINEQYEDAVLAQDVDAIIALHTPDAKTMGDGYQTIEGTANLAATLDWLKYVGEVEITTDEVGPAGGDFVFERKHSVVKAQGGQVMFNGKSVVIYKRVCDKLVIYIKIYNSNA